MIRTKKEYDYSLQQYENNKRLIDQSKEELLAQGLNSEQVDRALQGIWAKNEELKLDIQWYESALKGDFSECPFHELGKLAIAIRIYKKLTQKDLAEKIGMTPGNFCRLEANQYYSANKQTIDKVFDALGYNVSVRAYDRAS